MVWRIDYATGVSSNFLIHERAIDEIQELTERGGERPNKDLSLRPEAT
jgi:hypothetical protein